MSEKLRIDTGEAALHEQVDMAWAALVKADAAPDDDQILVRGNALVRMTERGELEEIPAESLREWISEVAQFERPTKQGTQPIDPPATIAPTLNARDSARYEGARRVNRVVDVPVLSPEGDLITTPGPHPSGIYYRPADKLDGIVQPEAAITDDVDSALAFLLDDYLVDFKFEDDASRAHALGLLLLPFVREFIPGPTPMHVVLAPDFGTGKTYLAQAALVPGCGLVPTTPQTKSEEETRKRITASLLGGSGAVILDNLSGSLDSASLASALTTGVWKDRILGESKEVTLPVRNAWVATGNNLDLAPEQVRRAVPIFLDPGDVRPSDRDRAAFRHPDLLNWALENRRDLVGAALTLVQHWLNGPVRDVEGGYLYVRDGDPVGGSRTLGSFERWASVTGGILEAAGVEGFLTNREKLAERATPETQEEIDFLGAVYAEFGDEPVSAAKIAEAASHAGPLVSYLPLGLAGVQPGKLGEALGYWLRDRDGSHIGGAGGYRPVRVKSARAWRITPTPKH